MAQNPNSQKSAGEKPLTPERIMQLAWGYAPPLIIEAAVRHRVFDLLDAGPKTVEELSRESSASVRGLRAIMNALVPFNLLAKDGQRYSLTPESARFLVSSKPSFQGGLFRHMSRQLVPKWLQLEQIVATGKPAQVVNDAQTGQPFFEQLVEDIFPMSYAAAQVLGDALHVKDVTKPIRVLDLAAGSGVWGIALAQKSSQVQVTAVDWPGVIPVTRRVVGRHKLDKQFRYIEGDLSQADFGRGYDVATLGHILHSEGERRSRELLKRTFDALAPGGTIAIAEFLAADDRSGPTNAMIFAVNMLVNTDEGDTFSFAEIRRWLSEAGFKDARTLDAPGPSPLILATKPS